jgi:Pyruvate/2-oxoglutarate dehydrogenase complex, dihydrolipoamide dehydrogenase (E3) component, and related enzymes
MLYGNNARNINNRTIPLSGNDNSEAIKPCSIPRHVMIIGGGVAGMEAARVAARRGHKVELYEQKGCLGGNLVAAGMPEFKKECHALVHWYGSELHELNVPVHLHSYIEEESILQSRADVVLIATGSTPVKQTIPGFHHTFSAETVLSGKKDPGKKVIVSGGGLVGCETALWLRNQGKQVILVEKQSQILPISRELSYSSTETLKRLLPEKGIVVKTDTVISHATAAGVILQSEGQTITQSADSIITAIGYQSNNSLYDNLKTELKEIYLLGDAKQVKNIMHAVRDAYDVASQI